MSISREEAFRRAAEKVRLQKEKEEREDREFYERITTGGQWLFFRIVVLFSCIMLVLSLYETFVDGPSKKLRDVDWKVDRNWDWPGHKVLNVHSYLFCPDVADWYNRDKKSVQITYSPIFRTGKKLNFNVIVNERGIRREEVTRFRSIFDWFPVFQVFLLLPIFTYIFKRQSPWFNFARIASLVFVFPGTLIVIFFTMM